VIQNNKTDSGNCQFWKPGRVGLITDRRDGPVTLLSQIMLRYQLKRLLLATGIETFFRKKDTNILRMLKKRFYNKDPYLWSKIHPHKIFIIMSQ